MKPVHICHAALNEHQRIFEELILILVRNLIKLGFQVSHGHNCLEPGRMNLLVGHVLALNPKEIARPGLVYAVYQLEQLSHTAGFLAKFPQYLELLAKAYWVFDYSELNLEFLRNLGIIRASHLPLAYDPGFERFRPAADPDIDIAFVGALSPRRKVVLEELSRQGLCVAALCGVYGERRDQMLARARLALNIHQFEHDELEELRLIYLLSNRCCVVSERASRDPYAGTVLFASYEELVPTCLRLAHPDNAKLRASLAQKGYDTAQKRWFAQGLRQALQEAGL